MQLKLLLPSDALWQETIRYARSGPWKAGHALALQMENGAFEEWERVLAAVEGQEICGYCTVAKTDCIPGLPYTPYIGFVFVDEKHRGRRLSQRMIDFAAEYVKSIGFSSVYLISDHVGLYEKYGFYVIDRRRAPWGAEESIFCRQLNVQENPG
ncbi:MAG: GNAT family N-acetyltransferase [Clostridia bacterium]|nr:GNAT family N-acetyltransferase [Clostridia bacterium]